MPILTRRPGASVFIEPRPDAHPSGPADWFTRPIEVRILRVEGQHVRFGIEAVEGLRIWRGERVDKDGVGSGVRAGMRPVGASWDGWRTKCALSDGG